MAQQLEGKVMGHQRQTLWVSESGAVRVEAPVTEYGHAMWKPVEYVPATPDREAVVRDFLNQIKGAADSGRGHNVDGLVNRIDALADLALDALAATTPEGDDG